MSMDWDRDTSRTYQTLKWLILSMSCIGWYRDKQTRKRTKVLQGFNIVISSIIMLICAYNSINLIMTSTIGYAVSIVGIANNVMVTISLIFGSIYIPNRFNNFVKAFDSMLDKNPFYASGGYIYAGLLISLCIYMSIASANLSLMLYFVIDEPGFLLPPDDVYEFKNILQLLSSLLNSFVFVYPRFVIMSMTHCLCWVLRADVVDLCKELNKMADTTPSESQIEKVKRRYTDITNLSEMADNILCPLISVVLGSAVFFTCFLVNAMMMSEDILMISISYGLVLTSNAYEITVLLTQGCLLYSSINSCIAVTSTFSGLKMSEKLTGQTLLLVELMKNREAGLSFMKMFLLNKSSVLTVIGTLVTYTIVVIQFQPE